MKKLYIVKYQGGEYDSHYTTDIFVTDKKSVATKYCTKFNGILKKWKKHYDQYCCDKFSFRWIKDEHLEPYFNRWDSLREVDRAYWMEIEIR